MNPIRPLARSLLRVARPAVSRPTSVCRHARLLTTPTRPNQASVSSVNVEQIREDPGEVDEGDIIGDKNAEGDGQFIYLSKI